MEVKQKVSTKISPVNLARPPASSKDRQREAQEKFRSTLQTHWKRCGSQEVQARQGPAASNQQRTGLRPGRGAGAPSPGQQGLRTARGGPVWTWAQQTLLVWTHSRCLPLHPLPPLPAHLHLQALLCPTGQWSSCPAPSAHTSLQGPLPLAHPLSP